MISICAIRASSIPFTQDAADGFSQLPGGKRFHHELLNPHGLCLFSINHFAESGAQDNGDVGSNLHQSFGQLYTCQTGHALIGDHEIECARLRSEFLQGLEAIRCGSHGITKPFEQVLSASALNLFVVNEEYALVSHGYFV